MIKPWVFEFFPALGGPEGNPDPAAVGDYFAFYLDLWARDEALGFEGIFFSEHHFGAAFGPSPNLLIAAVAQRTHSLRLGVMGLVLPYYQPWRVVEEIAMLDHLTGGRLEIGTAVGIPQEMARVNIGMQEARERNDEAVEILDAALANNVVTYRGKHFALDNLRLVPRPLQQPSPPKWTTVVSEQSARKAVRRGSKISTGFNPAARIREIFDAYRDEADRAGVKAGPEHLALRRRVTLARSATEAKEMSDAVATRVRAALSRDPRANIKPVPDATGAGRSFDLGDDEFIAGTPVQVAEEIVAQCREVGAGHFMAVLHWSAPQEEVARGHELFGREVIPVLRKAGI